MRIVLVRHGETVCHALNRYAGSSDVALTPRGHEQAQQLADWAADADLSAVYASPLTRAQVTARFAAERLGLPLHTEPRLRELHFGVGEGLTATELAMRFPAQFAAFQQNPVVYHLPGGEDPLAAIARAQAALREMSATHTGQRILIVAHSTLIRLLLSDLLGVDPARYRQLFPKLDNVSLTELRFTPGLSPALIHFNVPLAPGPKDTAHARRPNC